MIQTLLLAAALAGQAPQAPQAPPPPPAPALALAAPCDDCVPGVANFARVSPALWRGGQPTAQGFRELARLGVRTVVSLRHGHDDGPLLAGTGLRYLRIPSRPWRPAPDHLARLLKVLEDPANWPVFLHCAEGKDRTGYGVVAYRMAVQGLDAQQALAEMEAFRFNHVWFTNRHALRHLDLDDLRARVRRLPSPELRTAAP